MKILVTGGCGYIGSALVPHLSKLHEVTALDIITPVQMNADWRFIQMDYRTLAGWELNRYDVIIHLAAHSSVGACKEEPYRAIENNLHGMLGLVSSLGRDVRFLYASSGSIYSNGVGGKSAEFKSIYDFTKYAGEGMVKLIRPNNSLALRFGTVCGVSPRMRWDLMINRMVKDAIENSRVFVRNNYIRRPILSISDLCKAVDEFLYENRELNGHMDISSFNSTVGSMACAVSEALKVKIEVIPDLPAYDFEMNCLPFTTISLEQLIDQIVKSLP